MVYVFKTSVKFKKQIKVIAPKINSIETIKNWNFDLEDCDKILRIEAKKLNKKKLLQSLNNKIIIVKK